MTVKPEKKEYVPGAWVRLAAGVAIIGMLFIFAMGATRRPPIFDIHTLALDRQIDTSALYYTDIEQFAEAEQWMISRLGGNLSKNTRGHFVDEEVVE